MNLLENAYSSEILADTVWADAVFEYVKKASEYGLACNAISREMAESSEKLIEKYLPSFERDREILDSIFHAADARDWNELYQCASAASVTPLGRTTKLPYEAEIAKAARSVTEQTMNEIRACVVSDYNEFVKEISFTGRMVRKLMQLLREYYAAMAEAKARRRILDFVDLEHMAVNLLVQRKKDLHNDSAFSSFVNYQEAYCKTETAIALAEQYDEIMLDEYQDTNAVQSLIFWKNSTDTRHTLRRTRSIPRLLHSEPISEAGAKLRRQLILSSVRSFPSVSSMLLRFVPGTGRSPFPSGSAAAQ